MPIEPVEKVTEKKKDQPEEKGKDIIPNKSIESKTTLKSKKTKKAKKKKKKAARKTASPIEEKELEESHFDKTPRFNNKL